MGGYVTSIDEFKFLDGVKDSVAQFSSLFNHIFVVTNQQCIGKNIISESNLNVIHRYMLDEFEKIGAKISKVYFAPELKNNENSTRKPKPDMAYLAQKEFNNVDFNYSIMVGDTDSDIKFGKNLGMKTVRIKTEEPIGIDADYTVDSLSELLKILNYD